MPEDKKSSKSGNKPTRFRPTKNRIEIKRSFICFDSRCVCRGLLLVFKIKTLCWDLVMDEDRERARVSAELGTPLEEIVKETPNIGLDEKLLSECEKCGRPHYFCDPKLYHPTNFIE
jgi:hypothetical protein